MATGAQTTSNQLNGEACALAQAWASTANAVIAFAAFVEHLDVAGLELAGFDSADAADFKLNVEYLRTVALIFQGQAEQTPAYNFADQLAKFVGPDPAGQFRLP